MCLGWIPGIIFAFAVLWLEQRKQGGKSSRQVGKLQSKDSGSNDNDRNAGRNASQQSPYNRKRRMNNLHHEGTRRDLPVDNDSANRSQGWQGW